MRDRAAMLWPLLLGLFVAVNSSKFYKSMQVFPQSIQSYDVYPLTTSASPTSYCYYKCGPYPFDMSIFSNIRSWSWNDTTPLGFQVLDGTLTIQASFCPGATNGSTSTSVVLRPRFNSHAYHNITVENNTWCEPNASLTILKRNLGDKTDFVDDLNIRSANTLSLEFITGSASFAYAMVASITLDLLVEDLRPTYHLTKPSYPFVCGDDLTVRVVASNVSQMAFYECSLIQNTLPTHASNISGDANSTLFECTFDGEMLNIYGLCSLLGNFGADVEFVFYPSSYFNIEFPNTYIELYFEPEELLLDPIAAPFNETLLLYLTNNISFFITDSMKVFWNGTTIPAMFVDNMTIVAKAPPAPNGSYACITMAINGIDQIPKDCSLKITYGEGHYTLPPQSPDPFIPPPPPPFAPLEPSGYDSFEDFSRRFWYIYLIIGGMAAILAVTIACIRKNRTRDGSDSENEYRPLGNLSELDIDPKLFVSSKDIKLINLIGHGSFASVHKGSWRGTTVAVKKLHPHMRETSMSDFVREAALMLNLRHPNIVALMGISRDDETISIITEYLDRGSLDDILHNEAIIIEPEHVRLLALDAAKGLTYLHAAGVLHRDLKCGNLLVDKDWNLKVADFGLSRNSDNVDATMTACGTPSWAAPEVIRHQKYSFKADVFSFGICLWEMATRGKPYEDIPPYQVVIAVAMKGLRPKLSPKIHKSFMRLMVQCWDDRADVRPSFIEISTILEDMQCPAPVNDTPVDPNDPGSNRRLRRSSQSISTGNSPVIHANNSSNNPNNIASSNSNANSNNTQIQQAVTSNGKKSNPTSPRSTTKSPVDLIVEIPGAAPAVPDFPSPLESDAPRQPFAANSPPSSLSGSGSHSRSPSSGESQSLESSKAKTISPKTLDKKSAKSLKKKWGKFAAYAVSAPQQHDEGGQIGSLSTIQEAPSQETSETNVNATQGGTPASSRDFVISL